MTIRAIVVFAGACAIGLLLIGPWVMDVAFGKGYDYGRFGLAAVAVGMGFHLTAGTLNQAALATGRAAQAARAWLLSASAFVVWMLLPVVDDRLVRAEVGYLGSAALLCAQLWVLHAAATRTPAPRARRASPRV
jgi:O-antigen/teichoic acid export membrane protein